MLWATAPNNSTNHNLANLTYGRFGESSVLLSNPPEGLLSRTWSGVATCQRRCDTGILQEDSNHTTYLFGDQASNEY